MMVHEIDPTQDSRWDSLVDSHPQASVFHSRGWLEALRRTYGYTPVAFTTSAPCEPLTNAVVFCKISSWLSGRRLVSLPFSDHCSPLVESPEQLTALLTHLQQELRAQRWRYVEVRPGVSITTGTTSFDTSQVFYCHKLDLRSSLDELWRGLHKNCVQRKIRRAASEGLLCEEGTSGYLLNNFYSLLVMTRRRHRLPAQPAKWFRNLVACMGEALKIRVALKNGQPVASILTLRHKNVVVYKYGCSDQRFNNMGGTQLLLWNVIREAKESSLWELDFGRSDCDASGLIAFKQRWGAARAELTYLRYALGQSRRLPYTGQDFLSKHLWSHAPSGMLTAAGRMLYRHMG